MANLFLKFFKEPAPIEPIQDKSEIDKKYKHFRWRIFYSIYLGYVVSYIGRKNIAIAMPQICKEFNVTKTSLGVVLSSFFVAYGIGKFVNGILADKSNVRTFFSTGMFISAICLFGFALATQFTFLSVQLLIILMSFFWGANGWFQSMAFPPIAKSLSYWYGDSERGMRWSIHSTSHQVGIFSATVVATYSTIAFGWRFAFYVPAVITLLTGFWLYNRLRDKPVTVGLPEIEEYKKEEVEEVKEEKKETVEEDVAIKKMSYPQMLLKHVLINPTVWFLVFVFFFVYVVRAGTEEWLNTFFIEFRHDSEVVASSKIASMSMMGVVGTILGAFVSDKIFKGRRGPVNLIFLLIMGASILGLIVNRSNLSILDYVYTTIIGMSIGNLQNLVGLQVVEVCCREVAAAANGFAGAISYFGSTLSMISTGLVLDGFGWTGALKFWFICTIAAAVLILVVLPKEKGARKKA